MNSTKVIGVVLATAQILSAQTSAGPISAGAFEYLDGRITANQKQFSIWGGWDNALNKGFLSGRFPSGWGRLASVDGGCIYNGQSASGCGDVIDFDPNGTVVRFKIEPLISPSEFVGAFFQEPDQYTSPADRGYDLRGAKYLVFEAASTGDSYYATFSIGSVETGSASQFWIASDWREHRIPLPVGDGLANNLFAFSVDAASGPRAGATLLLRNIRYEPIPAIQENALGLPLSFRTMGVRPAAKLGSGRVPVPIDQVLTNLALTTDAAFSLIAILQSPKHREDARIIADSLVAALSNDNHGFPIPPAKDGSRGLRNAYTGGDLLLLNDQPASIPRSRGLKGNVRLPGFTVGDAESRCGESHYCLVLNGAGGAANASAILALLAASAQFEANLTPAQKRYWNAAREIGRWIYQTLNDADGIGGYFIGYPDNGEKPDHILKGKSSSDAALIFAAFRALAVTTADTESAVWQQRAEAAARFLEIMYDRGTGSFFSGTVSLDELMPSLTTEILPSIPFGVIPDGPRYGKDIVNIYDYLDSQTLPVLALTAAKREAFQPLDGKAAITWLEPMKRDLTMPEGRRFQGYSFVAKPLAGSPDGISWQHTAQVVLAMRRLQRLLPAGEYNLEIPKYLSELRAAQLSAPFADGAGIVAAVLNQSNPVYEQCISVPFQCVPSRLSLGAAAWAIFAEANMNPLDPVDLKVR